MRIKKKIYLWRIYGIQVKGEDCLLVCLSVLFVAFFVWRGIEFVIYCVTRGWEPQFLPYLFPVIVVLVMLVITRIIPKPEERYIDVYVYRKCGLITFHEGRTVRKVAPQVCSWNAEFRDDKTKRWIISEMKYYIDKFKIPQEVHCCRVNRNHLIDNLSEEQDSGYVIIFMLFGLVFLLLGFTVLTIYFPIVIGG